MFRLSLDLDSGQRYNCRDLSRYKVLLTFYLSNRNRSKTETDGFYNSSLIIKTKETTSNTSLSIMQFFTIQISLRSDRSRNGFIQLVIVCGNYRPHPKDEGR